MRKKPMKRDSSRRTVRGRWIIGFVVVGTVFLTSAGWAGSRLMTTPSQVAARAEAPPASVVTVPVESRIVSDQIVTRGDVVSASSSNVLSGRVVAGVTATVVTALPVAVGSTVTPGSVLVQLSGRPVFALPGAFPAYRDLAEGSTGPDVTQLRVALKSLGYSTRPDKSGTFSAGTISAIASLYKKAKYDPPAALLAAEVVFIPVFPAIVESMTAQIGSVSSAVTLNVATGGLTVSVPADPQVLAAARAGAKVELSSEMLGQTVTATVSASAVTPSAAQPNAGPGDTAAPTLAASPALKVVPDAPLPQTWAGQNIRVTIVNASSNGKVLAVPVSAVNSSGDGKTQVIVITYRAGKLIRTGVEVTTGVVGGGYVGVTPIRSDLAVGSNVLVGIK